ncbi:MAG: MFS transporter [Lachnospiraceae bacterium]|nr:MFS transporter [Lachnospiraceae bacterium]
MKNLNRWVYAIVGVIVLLMAGIFYGWSMMSKSIGASRPDWTAAQLSLTFTLAVACFCIAGLIAGILSKKISPRVFVILAGIFMMAGFLIASATKASPAMLYIGFGILCVLVSGFAYNSTMSTISSWFPDRQGLISGILLMGFGLSSFFIGKIFAAVTPSDGSDSWCVTFRVIGIVVFVVMILCSFFVVKPGEDFQPPASEKKRNVREPASDINTGRMIRIPSFWMIYIWAIMVSAAGLALVGQASGIATQVGPTMSDGVIATVVGMVSVLNAIGRVIYGWIFDKRGYRLTMLMDICFFFLAALILVLALRSNSFILIVVGFIVGGFAFGGVTPIQSAIISDFYGRTYYSVNFPVIVTNLLIGSFTSTISGRLYDMSQSYMSTIFMIFGVTVVALVAFLFIRRPKPAEK